MNRLGAHILLLLTMLFAVVFEGFSQRPEMPKKPAIKPGDNLVQNASFEILEKKLTKTRQIQAATNWVSATGQKADLFSSFTEPKYDIYAPKNLYGYEYPYDGDNYAGIITYSYNNRIPRTYITNRLVEPLKQGKLYCISFKLSLSELSKYSMNNMGIHISKKEPLRNEKVSLFLEEGKTGGTMKEASNRVFAKVKGWDQVCGPYMAKGNERYITIGNFNKNKDTKTYTMEKTPEYKEEQKPVAYYYIDYVSVKEIEGPNDCDCKLRESDEKAVVYSKTLTTSAAFSFEKNVKHSTIYFANMDPNIYEDQKKYLDDLAGFMTDNLDKKLKVVGHCDDQEYQKGVTNPIYDEMAQKRIDIVVDYLVKKGVSSDRFTKESKGNNEPADQSGTSLGYAKNRRVEFKIVD